MSKWIIKLLLIGLVFVGLMKLSIFDGFEVASYSSAVLAALILSILNGTIRPIMKIFALPLTIITLGLFSLVINAITLVMVDKLMGESLQLGGFSNAFLISIILSLVNTFIEKAFKKNKDDN